MDEVGFISQWRAILAGGLAGVAAALVTYPLEVAETRLIVQNCREPTYIGIVHTLSKIYRTEGLFALYRGFSLTMLGMFAYSCRFFYFMCVVLKWLFFFVYFLIIVSLFFFHELIYWIFFIVWVFHLLLSTVYNPFALHSSSTIHLALTFSIFHVSTGAFPFSVGCYVVYMNVDKLWQEPPFRHTPLQNFINGCLAAGVAQTLSYPFETVKRKMQVIYKQKTSACKFWFSRDVRQNSSKQANEYGISETKKRTKNGNVGFCFFYRKNLPALSPLVSQLVKWGAFDS